MFLPVKNDFTFVWGINAGENLNQRALAAPVLAGQAMDLCGTNLKVDAV